MVLGVCIGIYEVCVEGIAFIIIIHFEFEPSLRYSL